VIKSLIWVFLPLVARAGPNPDAALRASAAERPIDGIMGNSSFIEEAHHDVFLYASFEHAFLKQESIR
jgi:hypothetical protein